MRTHLLRLICTSKYSRRKQIHVSKQFHSDEYRHDESRISRGHVCELACRDVNSVSSVALSQVVKTQNEYRKHRREIVDAQMCFIGKSVLCVKSKETHALVSYVALLHRFESNMV